jgi:hypothetical protein
MPSSANDERFDEKQNPPEKKNPAVREIHFFPVFSLKKGKKKSGGG